MDLHLLVDNLTNPALLFFFLGILAVQLKSDLEIPSNSSKFISLYLLFAIGFKGGQELSHSELNLEILWSLLFAARMYRLGAARSFLWCFVRTGEKNVVYGSHPSHSRFPSKFDLGTH